MAQIRNFCVARGALRAAAAATLFTVPANNTFIFKSLFVHNNTATALAMPLYFVAPAAGMAIVARTFATPASAGEHYELWTVLNGGDHLDVIPNVDSIDFWMAGAILPFIGTAPALFDLEEVAAAVAPPRSTYDPCQMS